jgi:hypothetical protein
MSCLVTVLLLSRALALLLLSHNLYLFEGRNEPRV